LGELIDPNVFDYLSTKVHVDVCADLLVL
jgi:hypothetical protein